MACSSSSSSSSSFIIRTPCSSANIGPGFDVIGLALSLYLELHVTIDASKTSSTYPLNCAISYEDRSGSTEEISLDPEVNLITRVALYVLRCHEQRAFPVETHVRIVNPIPLGRGLGSSGTAVVAGVMLGNEVGGLGLSKDRLLDYCLMIGESLPYWSSWDHGGYRTHADQTAERHPDNVAASLFGGFVGTYLNELKPEEIARIEIPLSEVLPAPAGGIDTGIRPPEPPLGIGHYRKFNWAKEIKAIAIIPDFVVPTANARNVLPKTYSRADVVSCYRETEVSEALRTDLICLTPKLGLQPPACGSTTSRPGQLTSRPGHDLPGHAGQSPPAISPDTHSRSDGDSRIDDPVHAKGPTGYLLVGRRADNIGSCHGELCRDRGADYRAVYRVQDLVSVEVAGTGAGGNDGIEGLICFSQENS